MKAALVKNEKQSTAAVGSMLGNRTQFVRQMRMMVKASIHFLDI